MSQAVPDVRHLLESVAAAVGTIRDTSETWVQNIQRELHELAAKRHDELIAYLADMPSRVADELERRRLVRPAFEFKADIDRIIKYAPTELIGRESETKLLQDACNQAVNGERKRPHVLTFVALGGEGKTSLVVKWAADLAHQDWLACDAVFAWSFYSQGTPPEFEKLVEDVQGHALTLNLFGSYLRDAYAGDIRRRDLVKLEEADAEEQGSHAFRVMDAYVRWLESSPGLQPVAPGSGLKPPTTFPPGQRALALLSLLGIFDRPATADSVRPHAPLSRRHPPPPR
ncbi:MAG: hypothetical protein ABIZ56_03035 [Chthoniobacteraceae bacterium]